MHGIRGLMLMDVPLGGGAADVASFTATTTGAATLTLYSLGAVTGKTVTVNWGDGSSNDYTDTAQRTHNYAGAGEWKITLSPASSVSVLDLRDAPITLNSKDIKACININIALFRGLKAGRFDGADVSAWRPSQFFLFSMPAGYAGTFNSADVSAWRPGTFYLFSMPAGYAGTFNSADVSAWRPSQFYLYSMPAGYAGTFNSADVSAWRPSYFNLFSMPAGYTITITAGGFAGWITTTNFQMQNNAFAQAVVDQILADFWAGFPTRAATGGTINLGGTNAAPSGVYQAANPPDTGKEYAFELVNDSQNINPTKKWATVTFTA